MMGPNPIPRSYDEEREDQSSQTLSMPSWKLALVSAAGFFYAISMQKFFKRDPLSLNVGPEGPLEFALLTGTLGCVFFAASGAKRRYPASLPVLSFGIFGLFALASSWRSFNPSLSMVKGGLLFVVLAIGYLVNQAGLVERFFHAIYATFTFLLGLGLVAGFLFPAHYPLLNVEAYSGRTRLSLFATYPGAMGDCAALLILLAPIIRPKPSWYSLVFLFVINILAGGKTSSAVLILLLAVNLLFNLPRWQSWKSLALIAASTALILSLIYLSVGSPASSTRLIAKPASAIYGTEVASEAKSFDGRMQLWTGMSGILEDCKLLGFGFDGARDRLLRIESWSGQSHNGFLEMALAGGIFGLTFFIAGLIGVIQACLQAEPRFRRAALSVLAYMLILSLTGIIFNFPSYFGFLILMSLFYQAKLPAKMPFAPEAALERVLEPVS